MLFSVYLTAECGSKDSSPTFNAVDHVGVYYLSRAGINPSQLQETHSKDPGATSDAIGCAGIYYLVRAAISPSNCIALSPLQ